MQIYTQSLPGCDHTYKFISLGSGSKAGASYMVFQCTRTSGTGLIDHAGMPFQYCKVLGSLYNNNSYLKK